MIFFSLVCQGHICDTYKVTWGVKQNFSFSCNLHLSPCVPKMSQKISCLLSSLDLPQIRQRIKISLVPTPPFWLALNWAETAIQSHFQASCREEEWSLLLTVFEQLPRNRMKIMHLKCYYSVLLKLSCKSWRDFKSPARHVQMSLK